MKKILSFMLAAVLCFSLVACSDENKDSSGGKDPGNKPGAIVDQDLSMFDTVKHYGMEQVKTYTLTLIGDNATFLSGGKTAKTVVGASLPEIKVKNEGEYVKDVRYVKTGKEVRDFRFRMPEEDCEIEIITTTEKPAYFAQLNVATDRNGKEGYDYQSSARLWVPWEQMKAGLDSNSPFTMNREYSIGVDKKNVDINGNTEDDFLRGVVLRLTGVAGNAARMLTGVGELASEEGITAGQTYTFTYNFQNFGEKEISFRMYQGQTGIKLQGAVAVNAGKDITLKPGASASYNILFTAVNDNTNIIPIIELRSDFEDTLLGIAIAKENSAKKCEHSVEKIQAKDGDCGYAGNIEYYGCSLCGGTWSDDSMQNSVSINEVTVKKEHDLKGGYRGITPTEHSVVCSVCHGGVVYEAHKYYFKTVKEPTETESGIKEEVCDCGIKTGRKTEFAAANKLTVITETGEKKFDLSFGDKLNEEAKALLEGGFYDVDNHKNIYTVDDFNMPDHNLTVKPLSRPTGISLDVGSAFGSMDVFGGGAVLDYREDSGVKTETFGVVKGKEVQFTTSTDDVSARFKASYGERTFVGGFTYYVTVENRTGKDLNMRVAQVNSGTARLDGATSDFFTLKTGESRDFVFVFPDDASMANDNALTLISLNGVGAGTPVVLGISVSYQKKA